MEINIKMCIIDGEVEEVSKTNIFVCPLPDNHQLTVYSNNVASIGATMILPFYKSSVSFIDMTKNKDIFNDLKNMFTPKTRSLSKIRTNGEEDDSIEYTEVGSYSVAIVRGTEALSNVSDDYKISEKAISYLKLFYENDYDFLACRLKDGENSYEPFAYITKKSPKGLFIPTRHYHGSEEETPDWDHVIYSAGCKQFSDFAMEPETITSNFVISRFCSRYELPRYPSISRIRIKNYKGNHDSYAS